MLSPSPSALERLRINSAAHANAEVLRLDRVGTHNGKWTLRGCRPGKVQAATAYSRAVFYFLFSVSCFSAVVGCAAPGEPQPRRPLVPEAVRDLTARQSGDGVVLTDRKSVV